MIHPVPTRPFRRRGALAAAGETLGRDQLLLIDSAERAG
jgi:hypothetical protein